MSAIDETAATTDLLAFVDPQDTLLAHHLEESSPTTAAAATAAAAAADLKVVMALNQEDFQERMKQTQRKTEKTRLETWHRIII